MWNAFCTIGLCSTAVVIEAIDIPPHVSFPVALMIGYLLATVITGNGNRAR